ncbi:adenosylmethionine--8-amino-7-oxononanoate transaminase [Flavobacteriaceae bacterium UJ101]|nr:adenosylmethionine--8-amino-7-oxononanoate transaminase [Flavobacteriaceae bacterium UJ101]
MISDLQQRDLKHLWHPITQHQTIDNHLVIKKAKGVYLYDENNQKYIDGFSSWYTCMYGHCNEAIIQKAYESLQQFSHIPFVGLTHKPAIELSETLIKILPKNQQKIFFSENGSTSVDLAIKMALQYFHNQNIPRTKIIAFEDAFHGDTFGAMSVSNSPVYHKAFNDFFIDVIHIPVPNDDNFHQVKKQFSDLVSQQDIACFIYEPLVQGANCMKMFSPKFLDELIQIAQKYNTLCIADEVMTGFGKTGKNFASDHLKTNPDIICLAKSLTAGVTPMALTTCTEKIYQSFLDNEMTKGLMHAHTYSASPLGCSVAKAAIDLLTSKEIRDNIQRITQKHQSFLQEIKQHPKVKNARTLGIIFAFELDIEMKRYGKKRNELYDFFMEQGVFLRPLGNTIYLLPPYIISDEQLDHIYHSIQLLLA